MKKINLLFVFAFILSFSMTGQEDRKTDYERIENNNENTVYSVVEQMPEFKGGQNALFDFISKNLIYPPTAVEQGIEGRVVIRFIVSAEGNIQSPRIIRGVAPAFDEEALRIINLMPEWNPGKQNGKSVAVFYTVPIRFKLSEEQLAAVNPLSHLRSNLSIKALSNIYDYSAKNDNQIPEIIDTLLVIHKSREKARVNDSIKEPLIYYIGALYHNSGKYKEAIKYTKEGIRFAPTNYHYYNMYGLCLFAFGKAEKGKKAEKYYNEALHYYNKALETYPLTRKDLSPYPSKVYRNLGLLYLYKAYNTDDKSRKEMYFEAAVLNFEQVVGRRTTSQSLNFALLLGSLAEYKSGEEADSLYHRAIEILQKEEEAGIPETIGNYYLWGGALQVLGNGGKGEEADSLYQESIKLLKKALTFIPNIEQVNKTSADAEKLKNGYMALQYSYAKRAILAAGSEADTLLDIAIDYGEKAIQLGAQPYNHACAYALMSDAEKAFPLLRQALKQKEITFVKVKDDSDWDKLRNHAEYKKLERKYR